MFDVTPFNLTVEEEAFLAESNRIEGITRALTEAERLAFDMFLRLDKIEVDDLIMLVSVFQPDAKLRDQAGLDVRVGNYYPPKGGVEIGLMLEQLLDQVNAMTIEPYQAHVKYESLHPFTDGNGRSGRMLWWWMMGGCGLGFLHKWYYQSLENCGDRGRT